LRSGRVADGYLDKYQFEADPALPDELAVAMAPLIPAGTEVPAGHRTQAGCYARNTNRDTLGLRKP
jgi:hypothetical protein